MRKYPDDELDVLIGAVTRARLDNCEPPPAEKAWARFQRKMRQGSWQKPVKQKAFPFVAGRWPRLAAAAVLVLAVVTALSFNPAKVRALGYKVLDNVEVLLHGTLVNLRGGVVSDDVTKLPPPPEDIKEIPLEPPVTFTLEQAKERAPFPLRIPKYLPPGYRLENTVYQKTSLHDTAQVTMQYRESKENYFTITQFNFTGELGYEYGFDSEDTVIKEVLIGPHRATMAQSKNEFIHLFWIDGKIKLDPVGRLPAGEAVKIAGSIYDRQDQKK